MKIMTEYLPWNILEEIAQENWDALGKLVRYIIAEKMQNEFNAIAEKKFSKGCDREKFTEWVLKNGDSILESIEDAFDAKFKGDDQMWTATYTEIDFSTSSVTAFGNLNGTVYNSRKEAWNAILGDIDRLEIKNATINRANGCAEAIDYDDHGTSIFWELQRLIFPSSVRKNP